VSYRRLDQGWKYWIGIADLDYYLDPLGQPMSYKQKLAFPGLMRMMFSMPLPDDEPVTPEEMMVLEPGPEQYDLRSPFRDLGAAHQGIEMVNHFSGWDLSIPSLWMLWPPDLPDKIDLYAAWAIHSHPGTADIYILRMRQARLMAPIELRSLSDIDTPAFRCSFRFTDWICPWLSDELRKTSVALERGLKPTPTKGDLT
jgi:hypothetical protein